MVEDFDTIRIWQAKALAPNNTYATADADRKFSNVDNPEIHLDYCIASNWSKKRTDTTGVQSEVDVHPDTGPAGGFVEIQLTIDRSIGGSTLLDTLLKWYGTINTDSDFRRGFIGLENTDNDELNLIPLPTIGYRLVQFQQINPVDFQARQIYRILLQFGGLALDLPQLS
jgi:hypothetical protein